jgi:hypothetical protein
VKGSGHGLMVLSLHLPGEAEENHENLSQNSRYTVRDMNLGPTEYDAGMQHRRIIVITPSFSEGQRFESRFRRLSIGYIYRYIL